MYRYIYIIYIIIETILSYNFLDKNNLFLIGKFTRLIFLTIGSGIHSSWIWVSYLLLPAVTSINWFNHINCCPRKTYCKEINIYQGSLYYVAISYLWKPFFKIKFWQHFWKNTFWRVRNWNLLYFVFF